LWLGDRMRLAREKLLRMNDLGWHAWHRREAVYAYDTSCSVVARAFRDYRCVSIDMLGEAFNQPTDPGLG
jgi:hypothetical protein